MKAVAVSALALMCFGLAASSVSAQPPLEALPEILQLQLNQHPAWRAYKDAAAEDKADAAHEQGQAEQLNTLPTPQRLDALMDQMKKQQAAFQREADATKAFYAVLSPEQRQIFDQVTRLPVPPPAYRPRPPRYNPNAGGYDPNTSSLRVPPTQTLPPLAPPPPPPPVSAPQTP
ncbi:MAG: Spy/CpxP family protein refolding chaperone [Caulobacteraceae bacterium]